MRWEISLIANKNTLSHEQLVLPELQRAVSSLEPVTLLFEEPSWVVLPS